jgi:hypothetical protein
VGTGSVKRVALGSTHITLFHLHVHVCLSGGNSSDGSKHNSSDYNTSNNTTSNDSTSLGLVIESVATHTTSLLGGDLSPIGELGLDALLEGGVTSADVAIGVSNNARPGVECASDGSIASGELAPIGGVGASYRGLDAPGGGIASGHVGADVGGSAGYVGVRAGRLESDFGGVANIVGASVRVITVICYSVVALHLSNTRILSADIGIVTDPSSGSATNASIANGGGAGVSRIKPGAVDGGVGAVVETVSVHTGIFSAVIEIVTVRRVEG